MCLIAFAYGVHPRHRLVVAANRDEYYRRPTLPLAPWLDAPHVVAGRDGLAGGTWLGLTRQGGFAALTNYREPVGERRDRPSRGHLVADFLIHRSGARDYIAHIAQRGEEYNGFNLLVGDATGLFYYGNRAGPPQTLSPGLYALSNGCLDTPWPKVEWARQGLARCLNAARVEPSALFALLAERRRPPDDQLPHTGVGLDRERILSAIYIEDALESPQYGTRSSTAVVMDHTGRALVMEKPRRGTARAYVW